MDLGTIDEFFSEALSETAPGDVAVQLRMKDLGGGVLLSMAEKIGKTMHAKGGLLFVNDRADVAMASGADGVHLGGTSFEATAVRKIFPEALVGVSTHSVEEAKKAEADGADFIVSGPVFETRSKPGLEDVMGVSVFSTVCKSVKIPVFALGGIDEKNAGIVMKAGAAGVACISAVAASRDPALTVKRLLEAIRKNT